MTDREKLIELRKKYGYGTDDYFADGFLENGVIAPPCKIGDTVYTIARLTDVSNVVECTVEALHITSGKNRLGHNKPSHALLASKVMPRLTSRVYFEDFGITAFLTREEAEKTLDERSKSV